MRPLVPGLCVLILAGAPACAAPKHATPDSLAAQIAAAKPGDVLTLAPGSYGKLTLSDLSFSPAVTLSGKGAVFEGMDLRRVEGLNFVGMELALKCGAGMYPAVASASKSLRFEDLKVSGDEHCWAGLFIRDSENVTVTRSEFTGALTGLMHLTSPGVTVSDSYFHHLRNDGILGGCSSHLTITGNRFHDFRPTEGAHPDAVQIWTTNCKIVSTDILVANNMAWRGDGGIETVAQGVFITGGEPFTRHARVTVTGNLVLGGMYNGITVEGTDGGLIADNVVLGFPDMENWIRASDNTGLTITGNTTQSLQFPVGDRGVTKVRNKLVSPVRDRGAALLAARKAQPSPDAPPR